MSAISLLEKYRPQQLCELLGQDWVSEQLTKYLQSPYPCAFLFAGETGTGKTTAALLLAEALGVQVDQQEFGGLHQIASGEQTGESVRKLMAGLSCRPFFGSGWKVAIVNEADAMTPGAAFIWLDALENLPPNTVVIFTTNNAAKIPARLRDRCERLDFESSALLLRPTLQDLIERIWRDEGRPATTAPQVEVLRVADDNGNTSFRRLLQSLTLYLRVPVAPAAPAPPSVPVTLPTEKAKKERSAAALKAWETRRKAKAS